MKKNLKQKCGATDHADTPGDKVCSSVTTLVYKLTHTRPLAFASKTDFRSEDCGARPVFRVSGELGEGLSRLGTHRVTYLTLERWPHILSLNE